VLPKYEYGEAVRVIRNIRNDGTFPGQETGTLLVPRGSIGYVRDVGTFLQDQLIYTVHFLEAERLVGCREEELQPADAPWTPSRFEFRQKVAARVHLASRGRVLVEPGEVGEVTKIIAEGDGVFSYHIYFDGDKVLQVPETALEPSAPQPLTEAPSDAQSAASPAPSQEGTEP
jgi:nitrogen fixation protein NifZ